jgi:hypothetical protein
LTEKGIESDEKKGGKRARGEKSNGKKTGQYAFIRSITKAIFKCV